ncbi:hypothetical protein MFLAVUS_005871 [Mucor flavus]|uniref:Uncharacterized protein n=1 Tax=Mucor flavus TaxID=439312 RepID=A0ABP9YZY4_9FUNG
MSERSNRKLNISYINNFSLTHVAIILGQSDQSSSNFVVPTEYSPDIHLISQVMLNDKRIVNVITETLANAPPDLYITEPLPSFDKRVSNVFYIPPGPSNNIPYILISVVESLEDMVFHHILLRCIKIREMYHVSPICVIIVAQEIDDDTMKMSSVYQELPFFRDVQSTFWAEKCLIVSAKDCRMNRSRLINHPLLDIVFAITSKSKLMIIR